MAIEIQARPVNWCPHSERRRRRARATMLAAVVFGYMFWAFGGFGL